MIIRMVCDADQPIGISPLKSPKQRKIITIHPVPSVNWSKLLFIIICLPKHHLVFYRCVSNKQKLIFHFTTDSWELVCQTLHDQFWAYPGPQCSSRGRWRVLYWRAGWWGGCLPRPHPCGWGNLLWVLLLCEGRIQVSYCTDVIMGAMRSLYCLLSRLFRRRSKRTSKLCVNGLCAGNSPVIGEFPAQRASNAKNVSIWIRHRGICS